MEDQTVLPLAWDNDNSMAEALSVIGQLCGDVVQSTANMDVLFEQGLDPEMFTMEVRLSGNQAAMVISGLQLLGVFCQDLRDDITVALHHLHDRMPDLDEGQKAEIQQAVESFMDGFIGSPDEIPMLRHLRRRMNGDLN